MDRADGGDGPQGFHGLQVLHVLTQQFQCICQTGARTWGSEQLDTKESDRSQVQSTGPKTRIIYLIQSHLGTGPKLIKIDFLLFETMWDRAQSTGKNINLADLDYGTGPKLHRNISFH